MEVFSSIYCFIRWWRPDYWQRQEVWYYRWENKPPDSTALTLLLITQSTAYVKWVTKMFPRELWTLQASLATKSAYREPCPSHFIVFLFSHCLVALKPQCSVLPAGAFCSSQILQGILHFTAVFSLPFLSSGLF